jgi:hypothetical protein
MSLTRNQAQPATFLQTNPSLLQPSQLLMVHLPLLALTRQQVAAVSLHPHKASQSETLVIIHLFSLGLEPIPVIVMQPLKELRI